MNSCSFCFLITRNKKQTCSLHDWWKTQKEFLLRMKKLKYLRVQSRSDICAENASTRLRRHGARSFLRSLEVLSPRYARTSRNNSSRAGSFSCCIWLWQTCGRSSQSTRQGAPTHELHYVQKLAARADNNLVALSAWLFLLRALDARCDSHVNYVARRVELKMHALVRLN